MIAARADRYIETRALADRRVRCVCNHQFTPDGHLKEGYMIVRCRRCRWFLIVFTFGPLAQKAVIACTEEELPDVEELLDEAMSQLARKFLARTARSA